MKVLVLCFALVTHGFPMEGEEALAEPISEEKHIIKYEDVEEGHGHTMTGVAGEKVEGSYFHKVPEGDTVHLKYTADESGFVAVGEHLPVAPEPLPIEPLVHPVMVEDTPEVAEAKEKFEAVFNEVQLRNAALEEVAVEAVDNAIDEAVAEVISERRRRDAEPEPVVVPEPEPSTYMLPATAPNVLHYTYPVQTFQYSHYAPTYPYVYYNYPHPLTQNLVKTIPVNTEVEEMESADAEPEPMSTPVVQLPLGFRTLSYPSITYNPYNTLRLAPAASSLLPALPQEGEDEPAALKL